MKIKILKSNLLNALTISSSALCLRTSLPILECFLIEAKNNKITITTNNTDITIINQIEAEVIENGSVAIEGKLLIDYIKGLPEKDIILSVDENYLCKITCDKDEKNGPKGKFQCKDSKDFPKTLSYSKDNIIELSEYQLKKAIEKTLITVSKEDERKELTGVFLQIKNDELKMKSLDGYKLGIVNQILREKQKKELKTIIPHQTLENVLKIIKGEINKEVKIYINEKNVVFETENVILISNIIQKEFPQTEQIEKNEYKIKVTVNRLDLLNSIKLAQLFTNTIDEKPVILNIKNDKLKVEINSLIGSMEENIDIKKTGDDISIAFYHKHILPILNSIEDEEIKLYLNTSDYPIVIKDDNENYYYLILPVTIK